MWIFLWINEWMDRNWWKIDGKLMDVWVIYRICYGWYILWMLGDNHQSESWAVTTRLSCSLNLSPAKFQSQIKQCEQHLGMDQYLLIPFLVGWTSIYQLFWCSPGVQGFDPLPSESKRQVFQSSMWDMSTNENSTNPQHSAVPRQRSSSPRLADDFAGEPWLTVHRHRPIRWFTVTDQVTCQNLCSKKIWIWLAEHPWPDISIFMIWIGVNLWTTQVSPRLPRSRIFTNWLLHLRLFLLHLWLVKLHHTGWQLVCNPQQQ